jgi:hypothetical protein
VATVEAGVHDDADLFSRTRRHRGQDQAGDSGPPQQVSNFEPAISHSPYSIVNGIVAAPGSVGLTV